MINNNRLDDGAARATFGHRKVVPRICVADPKDHIRTFLCHALDDLGFVTAGCGGRTEFTTLYPTMVPDLVMMSAGTEACEIMRALADADYEGQVLLFGAPAAPLSGAVTDYGEALGLAMLPLLATPFTAETLHARVAPLLPAEPPPSPPIDVGEALNAGWLELWYQPKIDVRSLSLSGAEALMRLRHPAWGIIAPARFIPDALDPHFRAFSDFVIARALEDWRTFVTEYGPLEIAINLPTAFFQDMETVRNLGRLMPDHPAFEGLIVEMNGNDIAGNIAWARDVARELRFSNIGVSVDDLGTEWPAFLELRDFPFVEIKVDREFVGGCADDRLKQRVCRDILELADKVGARTVAEGVETRADFVAVRDLGFNLVQGFLFAKPAPARKFARTVLRRPPALRQ